MSYFKKASEALERISKGDFHYNDRAEARELRKKYIQATKQPTGLVKIAFDTRRVDQEVDFIPRRNLQNYHRSDPFIDEDASFKIKNFFKLKTAVDSLKEDLIKDPDWQDSYCRVLSAALDRTLRVEQRDMDFFKPQLDYLEELLYVRYRLASEDIQKMSEYELRNIIINRDEKLVQKAIYSNYDRNQKDISKQSSEKVIIKNTDLLEQLFGNVKASADNREVERTVTITIRDKYLDSPPNVKTS